MKLDLLNYLVYFFVGFFCGAIVATVGGGKS
jgi:hypothetical protein